MKYTTIEGVMLGVAKIGRGGRGINTFQFAKDNDNLPVAVLKGTFTKTELLDLATMITCLDSTQQLFVDSISKECNELTNPHRK